MWQYDIVLIEAGSLIDQYKLVASIRSFTVSAEKWLAKKQKLEW